MFGLEGVFIGFFVGSFYCCHRIKPDLPELLNDLIFIYMFWNGWPLLFAKGEKKRSNGEDF